MVWARWKAALGQDKRQAGKVFADESVVVVIRRSGVLSGGVLAGIRSTAAGTTYRERGLLAEGMEVRGEELDRASALAAGVSSALEDYGPAGGNPFRDFAWL
jgi:hypothetical protein